MEQNNIVPTHDTSSPVKLFTGPTEHCPSNLARNVVVLVHQPAYRNVEAQKLIRRAEVRLDATYTACPASTNTRTTTHISNIET